jgi:hypothetical protein
MLKNILNLEGAQQLSKKEQNAVFGGIPSGSCAWEGGSGYSGVSGTSIEYALGASAAYGGHWCCDSCCSVGWLDSSHKAYLGCGQNQ